MEKPSGYTALLDSSVLFPVFGSNLLLFLAERHLFQVKWSQHIHEEWINSRMTRYPDGDRDALERRRERMDREFEEAMVTDYEAIIAELCMDDPGDRHVLAAAIKCSADVIVTENVRHFPPAILAPFRLFAQTADDFIADQVGVTTESAYMVAASLVRHKKSLTKSRPNWTKYFEELARKLPYSFSEFNTTEFRQIIATAIVSGEWRY